MSPQQILNKEDFLNKAEVPSNLKDSKFNAAAIITQEKFLTGVLCRKTYNDFVNQWSDGGESYLETKYQDLLPFIINFLVFKTRERLLTTGPFIDTISGTRVVQTDIDRETTSQERSLVIKQASQDADFYKSELINYLEENKEDFEMWKNSKCGCSKTSIVESMRFSDTKRKDRKIKWT